MDFLTQNPDELIKLFSEFLISQENAESIYGEVQGGIVSNLLKTVVSKYKQVVLPKKLAREQEKEEVEKLVKETILSTLMNTNSMVEDLQKINQGLLKLLDGQNLPQKQAEERYQSYLQHLKELYLQPDLFNNTKEHSVFLSQLYIDPSFEYYQPSKEGREEWKKATPKLPKAMLGILKGENPLKLDAPLANSQFILLLGQPGQGKSSFCKRFLHDYIQQNLPDTQKVFYLRLRDLVKIENLDRSPYENLTEAIKEQMRIELQAEVTVNALDLEKALLVLDGLDELQMVKEKAFDAENAVRFCDTLIDKLRDRKDWGRQCPKILLTSRYGRVNPSDLYEKQVLILRLASLSQTQQVEWTRRFAKAKLETWLTKELIKEYHHEDRKHLLELMEQPILLNMIAKLPEAPAGDLKKSQIYKALFDTLINRPYDVDKKLKIHKSLGLDEESLSLLIQETAFAIFQSGREYIHKEELVKTLSPKLQQFFKEAETNPQKLNQLRLLMMSFYMQERPRAADDLYKAQELPSDYAIEFVHKSLQEYMTAEYIWETLHTSMREKSDLKKEYVIIHTADCLDLLAKLFAKKRLSEEIVDDLIEIIEEAKAAIKRDTVQRLGFFFDNLLASDFLHPDFGKYLPTPPIEQCTNTFYGYWTILAHGQKSLKAFFAKEKANWKNFKRFTKLLSISNYYKLNLIGANLIGANLIGANLIGADLIGADLSVANLRGANLGGANLSGANLSGANLIGADLIGADLIGADLIGADLRGADLRGADLIGANLSGANLSEARGLTEAMKADKRPRRYH